MPVAPVAREELFARLAAGPAGQVSVVTPNVRLSRELSRELDRRQAGRGLAFWDEADVLPLSAFAARLYEDALTCDLAGRLPRLLDAVQERALWESAIRESAWGEALLAVPQAARECADAWALAHAWRIDGALGSFPGNDDALAFAEWSADYARRCARDGHTDAARLPDILAPLLREAALRKPRLLVAYAFDDLKPQEEDFLGACARAGIDVRTSGPDRRVGQRPTVRVFPSAREELDAAAQWARAKLEGGAQRVGVVVPDLGLRRKEVVRVFARAMHPGHNLPGAERRALPFNVSLGAPLADYPLVRAALSILELAAHAVPFEQASRLIRSPYIAGADAEMARRAILDASLRRVAPATIGLGKLVALATGAPLLRRKLEALFAVKKLESVSPHDWGRHFTALLAAVDFPGRSLDSAEYQAQAKFIDTLGEFTRLALVVPRMPMKEAVARLARLCADTLYQPESPAPVQVLGFIESLGLEFDALWVTGLTDEAWPARARPNPFIPPALQRKAGIPEASAAKVLERAKRITEAWLQAADEVIVSHPAHEEDRVLLASPLISGVPGFMGTPETRSYARYRDVLFAARRVERVPDGKAPPLHTKTPKGGTRILSDQAACPFRAFARHRLGAEALEEPVEGLDARARGLLLHSLMKELWSSLKGSEGLKGDTTEAIDNAASKAVAEARLDDPFAALERKRLAKLAREWLEVERERDPFEVVAMEQKRTLAAGGLELQGRIDRMDRLAGGGHAIIDYKTGRPTPSDWQGERPDDPQLPLYALNATEDIAAVAFAKLKTGEMRYTGFSRDADRIPEVKAAKNWAALVQGWSKQLEALGAGFAAGEARVDPKKLLQTCRQCDLQPLCRVYERLEALDDEGAEG